MEVFNLEQIGILYINIYLPNNIDYTKLKILNKNEDGNFDLLIKSPTFTKKYNFYIKNLIIENISKVIGRISSYNNSKILILKYNTKRNNNFLEKINNNLFGINVFQNYIEDFNDYKILEIKCNNCSNIIETLNNKIIFDLDENKFEEVISNLFVCYDEDVDKETYQKMYNNYVNKINIDNYNIYIKNENKINNININIKDNNIYCNNCKEKIGSILKNKLNYNILNLIIHFQNKNNIDLYINNIFDENYLNILIFNSFKKNIDFCLYNLEFNKYIYFNCSMNFFENINDKNLNNNNKSILSIISINISNIKISSKIDNIYIELTKKNYFNFLKILEINNDKYSSLLNMYLLDINDNTNTNINNNNNNTIINKYYIYCIYI